ncbi:MAG: LytTR family DNA-binding domain-containing protein [Gemmatimonadaceae bacterium]
MSDSHAASSRVMRVLVVDDEMLGRQRVEDLLNAESAVKIVGSADNGDAAILAIRALHPDIVLLDVQMPGKTGLDVVRTIGPAEMPVTIFVTAFDQHALKAFELAAIDYLVKPFDDERFEQAFQRARRQVELQDVDRVSGQLLSLLQGSRTGALAALSTGASNKPGDSTQTGATTTDQNPAPAEPAKPPFLERIAVEMKGQVRVVPVKQVEYITASGPYAELHVGDKRYVLRERMQTLEERLDPAKFFRIHRSAIVRLDLIETLLRNPGGDYGVQLKSGVQLKVSRNRFEELEKQMGLEL